MIDAGEQYAALENNAGRTKSLCTVALDTSEVAALLSLVIKDSGMGMAIVLGKMYEKNMSLNMTARSIVKGL
jgi:hypothetical protein